MRGFIGGSIAWLLIALLMAATMAGVACNPQPAADNGEGLEASNGDEKPSTNGDGATDDEALPPSSGSGATWNDIPEYPGADQISLGAWAVPPAEGEWSEIEWRYFQTSDAPDEVASFYRSRMPQNGWEETAWFEVQTMSWAMFQKNNERDGAMFWVATDETSRQTNMAIMRATQ
jgi:hypothetical protein